jgi:tRNA pseudouridine38-40 synthase
VIVHGSGRTDAGVHAEGQVASVVLERSLSPRKLRAAINGNVGQDVRVMAVEEAPDDFHARYSAIEKTYLYRIVNGPVASPFWVRYAHHDARELDLERMVEGANLFVGQYDWSGFSAAQSDVEDRVRTISQVTIVEREDDRSRSPIVEIRVTANGFLRYMVRSIAGALLVLGRNEIEIDQLVTAIQTGVRPQLVATAPACGLTLLSVGY